MILSACLRILSAFPLMTLILSASLNDTVHTFKWYYPYLIASKILSAFRRYYLHFKMILSASPTPQIVQMSMIPFVLSVQIIKILSAFFIIVMLFVDYQSMSNFGAWNLADSLLQLFEKRAMEINQHNAQFSVSLLALLKTVGLIHASKGANMFFKESTSVKHTIAMGTPKDYYCFQ